MLTFRIKPDTDPVNVVPSSSRLNLILRAEPIADVNGVV